MKVIPFLAGFGCAALLLVVFAAWTMNRSYLSGLTTPTPAYKAGLERQGVQVGPEAFDGIRALFDAWNVESLSTNGPAVYTEDAYFRDGVKELKGSKAITEYMVHSVAATRSVSFDWSPPQGGENGNYYLPWVMNINLKRDPPDKISNTLGVSHLKFNAEGKVIFHQDYWDPSEFLHDRVPIANWLLGKVRQRL